MYLEPGRKDFNYLKHALLLDDRWTTYENRKFCFQKLTIMKKR